MDNKENKNTRKNKIIKVTALLGLFLLVFGMSYALFSVVLEGTKKNKITTGNIDVFIGDKEGIKENEEALVINLDNEIPISDEEGKEKESYEFTLVNNGSIDADYKIKLINNDISNEENRIQDKYVKYMLIKDGIEEIGKVSELEDRVIDSGIIKNKTINHYELKFWIDYNADNEAMNKEFNVKLGGEAVQVTKKEIKRVDVSENNDGKAYAVYYSDGTISIQGEGRIRSNLIDELFYDEATHVKYQKQILTNAGYDVSDFNTIEEIETFINDTQFSDSTFEDKYNEYNNKKLIEIYTKVFTKYGYDVPNLTTEEELVQFMMNNDLLDENGNFSNPELGKDLKILLDQIYLGYLYNDTDITIEEGITNIPSGLFSNITEITLPSTIISIDANAFDSCRYLKKVTLNNGLERIEYSAFSAATKVNEITIPSTVTYVGERAFYNWTSSQTINVNNTLESTSNWSSNWNSSLSAIVNYLK